MKPFLPPVALLFLSGSLAEGVDIAFAPEEGTTLKRTFEAKADYKLTDLEYYVDGEPVEDAGELPDYSMHFLERIAVSDELQTVEDGRPTALKRTFDELLQETTSASGDKEQETKAGSALEGRCVRFTWNADDEEYEIAAADEEELDEDLAAGLLEDMDLRLVLPSGEVEPGDEWELDPELYLAFMWPGGLLDFRDEGQEEADAQAREMSQQTIERLEGKGHARLEELREEDGQRLAVIHVELEITTGSSGVQGQEENDIRVEVEITRTVEGTILWDLEHGHAHSAELETEASRQTTRTGKAANPDGDEAELEVSELLEGTIHYSMTVERE